MTIVITCQRLVEIEAPTYTKNFKNMKRYVEIDLAIMIVSMIYCHQSIYYIDDGRNIRMITKFACRTDLMTELLKDECI